MSIAFVAGWIVYIVAEIKRSTTVILISDIISIATAYIYSELRLEANYSVLGTILMVATVIVLMLLGGTGEADTNEAGLLMNSNILWVITTVVCGMDMIMNGVV